MAPKRKETTASPPAKKRVRDVAADKLTQQLKAVDEVLRKAAITPEVQQMLIDVLPCSLGQFEDRRHRFQERVVDGVAAILEEVEATFSKEVADARARHDAAAAEKPKRDAEAAEASERMQTQQAEVQRVKVALAEKALAFRAATASLAEAEAAKTADGQRAQEAANRKHDFDMAAQDLATLQTVSTAEGEAREKGDELLALLRRCKFEESMMIALPAALAKPPDARGKFDMMAISQLESGISKMIADQESILADAKPGQERCEAAVRVAQEHLAQARAEQRAAARTFDAASKLLEEATSAAADTRKAVQDLAKMMKGLGNAVVAAEVEVELLQQGPMDTFKCLRERAAPVAEQPVAAVEEQATEPAAVGVPVVAVAAC